MRFAEKEVSCQSELDYIWTEESVWPFQELIVSFNARRPLLGYYQLSVSVFEKEWTEWLPYAYWSSKEQKSFSGGYSDSTFKIDQDVVDSSQGKAIGFRLRVEACRGADLSGLRYLHASVRRGFSKTVPVMRESLVLDVAGASQLRQGAEYGRRICAATATSAVVGYLTGKKVDPLEFAFGAYDKGFDVFGNWVFNVAQAWEFLGGEWKCWVQRSENFGVILDQLRAGIPIVVSVKGRLPGSYLPYDNGHLLVVIGYEGGEREVVCMDPAYPQDEQTIVRYPLESFLDAWSARGGLTFMFQQG